MTATSTMYTYLMKGTTTAGSTTWTKLVDIKSFPDLGGTPETLDTTTLSNRMQTNILGIQKMDILEFNCNYDQADFATLDALQGTDTQYAVWFGQSTGSTPAPDGHLGKFSFNGDLSVFVKGGEVNAVREMTISIATSTEITFTSGV